jgi:hypothetical protein
MFGRSKFVLKRNSDSNYNIGRFKGPKGIGLFKHGNYNENIPSFSLGVNFDPIGQSSQKVGTQSLMLRNPYCHNFSNKLSKYSIFKNFSIISSFDDNVCEDNKFTNFPLNCYMELSTSNEDIFIRTARIILESFLILKRKVNIVLCSEFQNSFFEIFIQLIIELTLYHKNETISINSCQFSDEKAYIISIAKTKNYYSNRSLTLNHISVKNLINAFIILNSELFIL